MAPEEEDDDEDASPPDLRVGDTPFAIEFHPQQRDLLVAGLVTGVVAVHDLSGDRAERPVARLSGGSRGSCRVATWALPRGEGLLTGYESGAVVAWDCSTAPQCRRTWEAATSGAVSTACSSLAEDVASVFACGDDLGNLYVWDARVSGRRGPALRAKPHEDFVSALAAHDGTLLACGADGRLSVSDPRRNLRRIGLSDPQDDELLSLRVIKDGRKVVCGTQTGALVIWSWGRWGDSSDRALGHPESVDAMLKVDEHVLCTGSSDGLLRVVRVQPGLKLLGILGDHDGFPVERLAANKDLTLVASISHDPLIRFWDARELHTLGEGDDISADAAAMDVEAADDDDDDWETDDDDDDGPVSSDHRSRGSSSVVPTRSRLKSNVDSFFDGL